MGYLVTTYSLLEALKAEGFEVPEECTVARVVMGVDSAIAIQFDCLLTDERLAKLGRALVKLAELPR